jgi:hypothetical protein
VDNLIDLDAERKKRAAIPAAITLLIGVALFVFAWSLDE